MIKLNYMNYMNYMNYVNCRIMNSPATDNPITNSPINPYTNHGMVEAGSAAGPDS